jgi:hypothetical protein
MNSKSFTWRFYGILKRYKNYKIFEPYKLLRHKLFKSKMVNKTNNKNSSVGNSNFYHFFSFKANFLLS